MKNKDRTRNKTLYRVWDTGLQEWLYTHADSPGQAYWKLTMKAKAIRGGYNFAKSEVQEVKEMK